MVRLIRLASVDDCIFKTAFGNDIIIEPGSKLAVLNATFETTISEISVSSANNQIRFTPDLDKSGDGTGVDFSKTTALIPIKTYSGELGVLNFFKEVNVALAETLGYRDTLFDATMNPGGAKINSSTFSEFTFAYDEYNAQFPTPVNPVRFNYTFSPMLSPFGETFSFSFPQGSSNSRLLGGGADGEGGDIIWSGDLTVPGDGGGTPANKFANSCQQAGTGVNNVGTKIRVVGRAGVVMSKGSGLWMARISNLIDNTDTGVENNGFSIGLSRSLENLGEDEDIPAADIIGQVRVNRPGEPYKFIFDGGTETAAAVQPVRFDANHPLTEHDIIWLRVGKDESSATTAATFGKLCLQGGVWQDTGAGGALETVFFTTEIPSYRLYYDFMHPYLSINGSAAVCEIDATAFTPSVSHAMGFFGLTGPNILWDEQNGDDFPQEIAFGPREYKITNILKTGNGTGYPASVIGNIVPQIDIRRFGGVRTTKLEIHADILRYLGFGQTFAGYTTILLKMGMDNLQFENYIEYKGIGGPDLDSDDNFIVESVTLPVDSYDASEQFYGDGLPFQDIGLTASAERKGRRKNILTTIPATNISKLVQYEASTPQFINLRNTSTINERNLEFRILDKDFQPVETGSGKSILTLLLSGPGE